MAPPASILFPTRARREYLAVALASVAPQAAAHGAEIVIVEDDATDAATAALAARHGARYVALGRPRGINVARNAAVAAASGALLCFLDDDVEVWPGWLDALLGASAEYDALGGPIRPRLEGSKLRACGREPLPVTSLDLGEQDRDAEFVWGANMALRRGAIERIGPFDETLGGAGDEEDWQRRLRAAGGRIGYVAAAGVDHRRTGRDAKLRSLARAQYFRGRASRRYDVHKARQAAPAAAESRAGLWRGGAARTRRGRAGARPRGATRPALAAHPRGRAAHARRLRVAHRAAAVRRRRHADRGCRGGACSRRSIRRRRRRARPIPTISPAAPARSGGGARWSAR